MHVKSCHNPHLLIHTITLHERKLDNRFKCISGCFHLSKTDRPCPPCHNQRWVRISMRVHWSFFQTDSTSHVMLCGKQMDLAAKGSFIFRLYRLKQTDSFTPQKLYKQPPSLHLECVNCWGSANASYLHPFYKTIREREQERQKKSSWSACSSVAFSFLSPPCM